MNRFQRYFEDAYDYHMQVLDTMSEQSEHESTHQNPSAVESLEFPARMLLANNQELHIEELTSTHSSDSEDVISMAGNGPPTRRYRISFRSRQADPIPNDPEQNAANEPANMSEDSDFTISYGRHLHLELGSSDAYHTATNTQEASTQANAYLYNNRPTLDLSFPTISSSSSSDRAEEFFDALDDPAINDTSNDRLDFRSVRGQTDWNSGRGRFGNQESSYSLRRPRDRVLLRAQDDLQRNTRRNQIRNANMAIFQEIEDILGGIPRTEGSRDEDPANSWVSGVERPSLAFWESGFRSAQNTARPSSSTQTGLERVVIDVMSDTGESVSDAATESSSNTNGNNNRYNLTSSLRYVNQLCVDELDLPGFSFQNRSRRSADFEPMLASSEDERNEIESRMVQASVIRRNSRRLQNIQNRLRRARMQMEGSIAESSSNRARSPTENYFSQTQPSFDISEVERDIRQSETSHFDNYDMPTRFSERRSSPVSASRRYPDLYSYRYDALSAQSSRRDAITEEDAPPSSRRMLVEMMRERLVDLESESALRTADEREVFPESSPLEQRTSHSHREPRRLNTRFNTIRMAMGRAEEITPTNSFTEHDSYRTPSSSSIRALRPGRIANYARSDIRRAMELGQNEEASNLSPRPPYSMLRGISAVRNGRLSPSLSAAMNRDILGEVSNSEQEYFTNIRELQERIRRRRLNHRTVRPVSEGAEDDEELAWRLQMEEYEQAEQRALSLDFPLETVYLERMSQSLRRRLEGTYGRLFEWTSFLEDIPRGMTQREIASIPKKKFVETDGDVKYVNLSLTFSCSICLVEMVTNDDHRAIPCAHIFHLECLDVWLQQKKTCPVCRGEVI